MKKIIFIVPYYGKWPAFFREWVYTGGYLSDQNIDFMLVTDLKAPFELPANFKVLHMPLADLKRKIQLKFDFTVSLETPYKLCDMRPGYGYIFEDIISEYDFWGHCDVDLIWGNVRKFISDDILDNFDKIQYLGHFVLYRNTYNMNRLFVKHGGMYSYETVFSTPEYYSFDEHPGMTLIAKKQHIKNYVSVNQADISPRYSRTYISRVKNYDHQLLYWENGSVYRAYIDEWDNVKKDEFMYAHFQQKKPASLKCEDMPDAFAYYATGFEVIDPGSIDRKYLLEHSDFVSEDVDRRESIQYKKKKIKKFISCSLKEKIIWIKIQFATQRVNADIKK